MTTYQKQRQLYFLGYYSGKIDGEFGAKSKAATAAFQADFGLEADGVFGAKTEAKTIEIVKTIQKAIGVEVDGIAGNDTASALRVWQKKNSLTADGIAGAKTRAKLGIKTVDFWSTVKYFKKSEFACKCGGKYCNGYPVEISHTLIRVAERARKHFGKPITVSSGIRCTHHNANVGGVSNSRHKLGKAMDFYVQGQTASTVLAWVKKQPEIRYTYAIDGYYVHMDVN
jgi:peptidoglycan hydrolase-like protein with peptidoglycan-binding domain